MPAAGAVIQAERAAARLGCRASTDAADALAEEVDAVAILLPHYLHYKIGCQALEAGKHVFMEKPLANRREECRDLIALARELLYNPNWPMDAAQKLGVDKQFGSVPPPQAYWLAKRAQSVKSVVPSTYMKGLNHG